MPIQLDNVDLEILKLLFKDARRSARSLAKEVGMSPPTVSSRIERLISLGLIKGFIPLIDYNKLEGIMTLIMLKVDMKELSKVMEIISSIKGVLEVLMLGGDYNLAVKLLVIDRRELYEVLRTLSRYGEIVSMHIIFKTTFDTNAILKAIAGTNIKVICDYCGQEVKGESYTLKIGRHVRFFCCRSCLKLFKEKYKRGISSILKSS